MALRNIIAVTLIAVVALVVYAVAVPGEPPLGQWVGGGRSVSAEENAALWAAANTALTKFVGAGLGTGPEGLLAMGKGDKRESAGLMVADFRRAIVEMQKVTPPGEQIALHRALLPIYAEIGAQMEGVVNAASLGDRTATEVAWQQVALLLDEAGTLSEMLADVQYLVVGNTGGDGVYVRRTPRADDRIVAWPDGTRLAVAGPDAEGEGRVWKHVVDPAGNVGWVPAEHVVGQ